MIDSRNGCCIIFGIISSCIAVTLGCAACLVFTFVFCNIHASLWALLSVIQSSMMLHLQLLYKSFRLENWHTPHSLSACRDLGLLTTLGGLTGTGYYTYCLLEYQESLLPFISSNWVSVVWSIMCVKCGLGLAYFGQKYKLMVDREYSLM